MEAEKYEALDIIGKGSFGVIRKVRRKTDGHILCRKEVSYLRMSQREREQLQAELSILKGLRHANIVAYYEREHLKSSSDLHIYMEYCENGDLGRRIAQMKAANELAEEDFVWTVFAQLVCGLYRCHKGQDPPEVGRNFLGLANDAKPIRSKADGAVVLHRDLKPENIFLGADCTVKIGDFGLSKIISSHDFASTYVGTPFYMSPEICAAENYGWASDIWALGCVIYELCAKEPPFNGRTHMELIQKIRLGRVKALPVNYSKELQDVVMQCIRVNQTTRPDTTQLLNLPMVKLKRKEMEIVALGHVMKEKIRVANQEMLQAKEFRRQTEELLARERYAMRLELEKERQLLVSTQQAAAPRKRATRAPLARAQTMVDSPADVHMADFSPIPAMRALNLSPRQKTRHTSQASTITSTDSSTSTLRSGWDSQSSTADDDTDNDTSMPPFANKLEDPFAKRPSRVEVRPFQTTRIQPLSSKPSYDRLSPKKDKENRDPNCERPTKLPAPTTPSKLQGKSLVTLASATIWDPERDEMPSPFLHRNRAPLMNGNRGGPGLSHLR